MNAYITQDVRNNSIWTQRFFCLSHIKDVDVMIEEIQFTLDNIQVAQQNESSWLYLAAYHFNGKQSNRVVY